MYRVADTRIPALVNTTVAWGRVEEIKEDGTLVVTGLRDPERSCPCDCLGVVNRDSERIRVGTRVLFLPPADVDGRGCVLGAVERYSPAEPDPAVSGQSTGQTEIRDRVITIAAGEKLTLKCGEGALTITEDGTVVLRGGRLLSRARGVNKIKGASVKIN